MIAVLRRGAPEEEVRRLVSIAEAFGVVVERTDASGTPILGFVHPEGLQTADLASLLKASKWVETVVPQSLPYPLVAKRGGERPVVKVRDLEFGGPEVVLMAGPCSVENESQINACAAMVASCGARVLRGGAYKPTTSPYGFRGIGKDALCWLRQAGDQHGLLVVTEVMDPRRVDLVSEFADILQVGTRNMQNYDLLREIGRSGMPVLLKRGMGARYDEWLLAAEHIAVAGSERIILCERGIRTFESATRNTLDISAIPAARSRTWLPIAVDPSHAAGHAEYVPSLALAAVAAGADALLIEAHPTPESAIKDGAQTLGPQELAHLTEATRRVADAVGRTFGVASPRAASTY